MLTGIKCAVFDQASLFMLAQHLCEDGDFERADRYVRFCEECNTAFSPQLRNYQIRILANVMDSLYQKSKASYSRLLIISCVGAFLLLGVIAWLLIRQRRRK